MWDQLAIGDEAPLNRQRWGAGVALPTVSYDAPTGAPDQRGQRTGGGRSGTPLSGAVIPGDRNIRLICLAIGLMTTRRRSARNASRWDFFIVSSLMIR